MQMLVQLIPLLLLLLLLLMQGWHLDKHHCQKANLNCINVKHRSYLQLHYTIHVSMSCPVLSSVY